MVGAPVTTPEIKAKLGTSDEILPRKVRYASVCEPSKVEHGTVHSVLHRVELIMLNRLTLVSETTHVWPQGTVAFTAVAPMDDRASGRAEEDCLERLRSNRIRNPRGSGFHLPPQREGRPVGLRVGFLLPL